MKKLTRIFSIIGLLCSVAPVAFASPIFGIKLQANVADQSGNIFKSVDESVPAGKVSNEGSIGLVDLTANASANLLTGELKADASCLPLAQHCVATANWFDTLTYDLTNIPGGETLKYKS